MPRAATRSRVRLESALPGREAQTGSVIVPCGPAGAGFPGKAAVPEAGVGRVRGTLPATRRMTHTAPHSSYKTLAKTGATKRAAVFTRGVNSISFQVILCCTHLFRNSWQSAPPNPTVERHLGATTSDPPFVDRRAGGQGK